MRIVVDASVAGAWVLPDEGSRRADRLLGRILSDDLQLCVPALWIYEVTNLLWSAERRGRMTSDGTAEAQALLGSLSRETFDHESALARERVTNLARKFGLSAYDAAYLELADRLQCDLATLDDRLARAAKQLV